MSNRFEFHSVVKVKSKQFHREIDITGPIRQVLSDICQKITIATGIEQSICEGYFLKSLDNWENEHNMDVNMIITKLSSSKQEAVLKEIMLDFTERLSSELKNYENRIDLKSLSMEVLEVFINNYSFLSNTSQNTPDNNINDDTNVQKDTGTSFPRTQEKQSPSNPPFQPSNKLNPPTHSETRLTSRNRDSKKLYKLNPRSKQTDQKDEDNEE